MSTESNDNGYRLAHTMSIRVLDLEKSIHFYCDILGAASLDQDHRCASLVEATPMAFVGYGPEIAIQQPLSRVDI